MSRGLPRIFDANANRAREALRVMEEAARFLLDDADLSESIKQLRHDLRDTLHALEEQTGDWSTHRDSAGDVGAQVTTEAESSRGDAAGVTIAAGKRLSEALRSLEEYAKVVRHDAESPPVSERFKQLRYRGYELERQLNTRMAAGRGGQWRVCLLLTKSLCRRPWREVLEASLRAGVDAIQVREKDAGDAEFLDLAHEARQIISDWNHESSTAVSLIVNDRPDIALLSGADGVHLGQGDLPVHEVRRIGGRRLIVGVSTSRVEEVVAAGRAGADYVGLGPMFETQTKEKPVIRGPAYVSEVLTNPESARVPHLAIGGIGLDNVREVFAAGARGVAVCGVVCRSDDPEAAARGIVEAVTTAQTAIQP